MRHPDIIRKRSFISKLKGLLALLLLMPFCAQATAGTLQPPSGKVILTVSGAVAEGDANSTVRFDLAGLEALGIEKVETTNPWLSGKTRFTGVSLAALLKAVGAYGKTVRAKALNDYRSDIPLSDLDEYPVLIAYRLNGEAMAIRDKGPLWIIYPMDGDPTDAPLEVRSRMVWQLNALEILE